MFARARSEGLEPPRDGLEDRLPSDRRRAHGGPGENRTLVLRVAAEVPNPSNEPLRLERTRGVEPRSSEWHSELVTVRIVREEKGPSHEKVPRSGVRESNPSRRLGRPSARLEQTPQGGADTGDRTQVSALPRRRPTVETMSATSWWTRGELNPDATACKAVPRPIGQARERGKIGRSWRNRYRGGGASEARVPEVAQARSAEHTPASRFGVQLVTMTYDLCGGTDENRTRLDIR